MDKRLAKVMLSQWRMVPHFLRNGQTASEAIEFYANLLDPFPLNELQYQIVRDRVLTEFAEFPSPAEVSAIARAIAYPPSEKDYALPDATRCKLCGDTKWMNVEKVVAGNRYEFSVRCTCQGGTGEVKLAAPPADSKPADLCPTCQSLGSIEREGRRARCHCINGQELPEIFLYMPVLAEAPKTRPTETRRALAQLCRVREPRKKVKR